MWRFFDTVGELAFAVGWKANALSRVRLRVMETDAEGKQSEVTEGATGLAGDALAALQELYDGETGQTQMMAAFGLHLGLPGEAYLVGDPTAETNIWRVLSTDECREQSPGSGIWIINRGDDVEERLDINESDERDPDALIIRLWRPHPRRAVEATSPVRAALPILRLIEGLTRDVASSIDSRLAGAGILLVPSEMTFESPVDPSGSGEDADLDSFLMSLADTISAALTDPGSAAARTPIIVKAPGAFIGNIQHLTFTTPFAEQSQELSEQQIRRLALSLDMPPEILLGQAESNHWSAWLISEDGIKIHVEPDVELITNALTTRYLWPALQGSGDADDAEIRRFVIDGDTSALRQRAADSSEAKALHDAMVISDAALLRGTRYDSGDMPDDSERRRRLLERVAAGAPTPELVAAALEALGVKITPQPADLGPGSAPVGAPVPVAAPEPPPAIEAPRTPPAPATTRQDQAAALLATSEVLVLRAIEKGWNRAGRRGVNRRPVAAKDLDAALRGAWEGTDGHGGVDRIAALCGVDQARLHATLDAYARDLLSTGRDYDPTEFSRRLLDRVLLRRFSESVTKAG